MALTGISLTHFDDGRLMPVLKSRNENSCYGELGLTKPEIIGHEVAL